MVVGILGNPLEVGHGAVMGIHGYGGNVALLGENRDGKKAIG